MNEKIIVIQSIDLRAKFAKYVKRVKQGTRVLISLRGKVVAELISAKSE